MKKILVLAFVVLTAINLFAQESIRDNVSGSPYLMIIKDAPTKADIELTKTDVDVNISGVIADVTVKQYYKSTFDQVLEAVYVFPASVHAAVYSLKMKIGSREVVAVIKEKEQARKDYEQAKSEGKRASLLEQDRPNLFQMNLANIAPGDLIEIEMKYTEMLVPDDKIYTFTFPTIAAPRYGGGIKISDVNEKENGNPQDKRFMTNMAFDINFNLISPVPIDGIECVTHEVNYAGETANHSRITLKDSEKKGVTKDFIVKYKLAGDLINSGLLLSKGEGKNAENFFLLTVQPPKRIDPAYIPPREYVFVLDVSGSMNGFPSVMAKKTILNLLDKLNKDDKFNLILFASGFDVFSENLVNASRGNLEKAFKFMAESRQGGGTELLPALETALKMPKNSKASRSIVVITDGLIDFESKAFKLIRDNLNKANVFTFGIGTQMNKLTIEGMAKAGMGLSFELDRVEDAEYQSERFIKYISTPILADIKVTYDGFGVSEVEPMSVPDLFPDRPIVIYGKWDGNLQGGIKIEAINGQDKIFVDLPVIKFGEMVQGDALKQLWARKQIELLSDYQSFGERDKYKKEITDLGLKYNLMTAYTSFIAVDNEVVPTIDKETNNNGNVPELYIKDGSPVKYIGQGQITNYQTTENITVRDALQKKPNLNGSLNNFTSQGFEVRNARSEDYQLTVDGQRISNAFVGGMGSSESSYSSICSQSSGAESSSSGLFMDDYSNSSVKHFFNQLSGDNETKKLSYDRQELEKNIKIIKNKLKLNINANGSLKVFVNSKGKITKIEPDSSNSDLLNQIALEAIKKTSFEFAKQSGFPIDGSIDIDISINVDDCDYNLIFDNQPYVMKFINNDNMKIWQTIIRIGEGRAINHLDKIKIEYFIYNENLKLINKDTVTVVADLGDAIKPVAESLKDMKVGGEKLLLFKTFYFTTGLYPMIKENPKSDFVFLKIKVLEINP